MRRIEVHVTRYADRENLILWYRDQVTERVRTRSARTTDARKAERAAAAWEAELSATGSQQDERVSWGQFRDRYESERLSFLSEKSAAAWGTAANHFERLVNPARLVSVTGATLATFAARLRAEGRKATSIQTYLGQLRPAFTWAVQVGLLAEAPKAPDVNAPQRSARARPVTGEEFDRLLSAVEKIRPDDAPTWIRYLTGLWLSGLRLAESLRLSWDDPPFIVDFSGRHPCYVVHAEGQKSRRDETFPLTPDFAAFLESFLPDQRSGPVFDLPLRAARVGTTVAAIGEAANVVVSKNPLKFASAHDLRRSFATRWAPRVKPATLQRLMRHKSIETTLRYYVSLDTDDLADTLYVDWPVDDHGRASTPARLPTPCVS